jgi:hypothetical protein
MTLLSRTCFLTAVTLLIGFATVALRAEETLTLAEQQQAMFDRLEEICDFNIPDRSKIDPQKLVEAIQLLRDSESLFAESDQEIKMRYISARLGYLSFAAIKSEDAVVKNALFDECKQVAEMIEEAEFRQSVLDEIRDLRLYGHVDDPEQMRTVEDALKIPKLEWRNGALSTVAQSLSRQTPPDFAEAVRAAQLISDEDIINRENCFSIIAVRQARAGEFDDAESTYQRISENAFGLFHRLQTLLTFAVILDEMDQPEAAKRWIDEAFAIGYTQKDSTTFIQQFFRYCYSCSVRMHHPEIVRYVFDKMLALKKEHDAETQKILAEYKAGIRTSHYIDSRDSFTNTLTFAKTAALLGEHKTSQQYLKEAKELLEESVATNSFHRLEHHPLIAALFDAGFEAEAQKELDEYILTPLREKRFPQGVTGDLLHHLTQSGRFTEIVTIVKATPDDEERFRLYDHIVFLVRLHHQGDERVLMGPPRKRFSSAQEIRDIAEMLTDEPDGKSLESYRAKIRKYADKL